MLTRKQLTLLKFIDKRINKNGMSPSFEEMKEALNLKSKSGIHRLIIALEERGFIRRLPHRARALEVIKNIDQSKLRIGSNEKKVFNIRPKLDSNIDNEINRIPLLGKIAAGTPIEAISDNTNQITVPNTMIGRGKHFALEVKGESMIDVGINHGDIVIIKEQTEFNDGDIVVALIENEEATLKKMYRRGQSIELVAANKNFEKQIYEARNVTVQGKLTGLLRSY